MEALARATRGHVARAGLQRAQDGPPRPSRRRRILATATSTGLVAPLFVLDGLPTDLADPSGPDWDDLGPGSVVAASATVEAAPSPDGSSAPRLPDLAAPDTPLLVGATPWVRAAGVPGLGVATHDELRAAEELVGLGLGGDTVTDARVERLRRAVLRPTADVCRALGLLEGSREVTPSDVLAAATALEVDTSDGLTPDLAAAVTAAGADVVRAHVHDTVSPYARALGLEVDGHTDDAVVASVAAELGVDLPMVPDATDAERLHLAWLASLSPHFARFGIDTGAAVDPRDTVALARALGADVDSGVGPAELTELLAAFDAQRGQLVPYATIGAVTMHLPSEHVVRAGWHESSSSAALVPHDLGADRSFVLPSRQRGTDGRSAMDVAVAPGTPVLAPVSGTVIEAQDYLLYGEHPDTRIRIRPDDDPSVVVTMLHVTGSQVGIGDHVAVGDPVASHATQLPFRSQIDDVVGRLPHVHLEAKYAP